jgi:hypothetical protein
VLACCGPRRLPRPSLPVWASQRFPDARERYLMRASQRPNAAANAPFSGIGRCARDACARVSTKRPLCFCAFQRLSRFSDNLRTSQEFLFAPLSVRLLPLRAHASHLFPVPAISLRYARRRRPPPAPPRPSMFVSPLLFQPLQACPLEILLPLVRPPMILPLLVHLLPFACCRASRCRSIPSAVGDRLPPIHTVPQGHTAKMV